MWPFKRTLSERYSKLVKLIKSIDSHFELTEDKEKSLRLHLPNYKGNQPMDFHIYLMEPFLFISFVAEIEGEKISCLSNYPQDTDQQDMFNLVMSNNLNKIHQVLDNLYSEDEVEKKDDEKEETDGNHNSFTSNNDSSNETWGLRDYYDFNESFKKHALTIMILHRGIEFRYFASKNDYNPMWSYIINGEKIQYDNCPSGAEPLMWIMNHYDNREDFCWLLEILDEQIAHLWVESMEEPEILIEEIQKYVPQFKLKNNSQQVKVNLGWLWIDIQAILHFIDYCSYQQNKVLSTPEKVKPLQECTDIEDLSILYWSDYTHEQLSQKESAKEDILKKEEDLNDSIVVQSWSFLDFAKIHGKMKRVPSSSHINSETGEEEFSAAYCVFVHPTNKNEQGKPVITAIVAFSLELGELTAKEIGEQKDDLIVVEYESGNYSLKRKKAVEEGKPSAEVKDEDLSISQLDDYSFEKISSCANNLFLSLDNYKMNSVDKKLLVAELTILSSAMVLDTKDEKITHWYDSIEKRILDYYLSINEVSNYDDWIVSNTPGMCSNDIYATEEAIPLAEFERNNGQIKFHRGQINAYPYDDSFWGEFINKNGQKQIIYVDQGFPFEYNTTEILNHKSDFGIVEEKDTYYHSEEVFYCLKKIRSKHSMLSSYVKERFSFYKKTIGEILANYNNDKAQIFQLYNAVTNERLNYSVPYLGIDDLVFNDETVVNDETSEMYQYDATSLNNFSKCIEGSLAILHQGLEKSVPNFDLAITGNQSIENNTISTDVIDSELNDVWTDENGIPYIIDYMPSPIGNNEIISEEEIEKDEEKVDVWTDEYRVKYSFDRKRLLEAPEDILNYSILDGTEEICDAAFTKFCGFDEDTSAEYWFGKLLSIRIPNSVSVIGSKAFRGCYDLKTIVIPGNVKEIGESAFRECESLTSLTLSRGLLTIGRNAFCGCKELKELFIPSTVLKIEEYAFSGCSSLKSIVVDHTNVSYDSRNNCNAIIETRKNSLIAGCYRTIIPNSIEEISSLAFENCYGLNTISIPEGVKIIGTFAFQNCKGLTTISLPDSLIHIGYCAFAFCESLESIMIPEGVTEISFNTFEGCASLISITLPDSIKEIGPNAFRGCTNLKTILIPDGSMQKFEQLLPQFKRLLAYDNSLHNEHVNQNGSTWTDEYGVQYDREKKILLKVPKEIEKYVVAEGTKAIGNAAFSNCDKLKAVILPDSTIEIGHYAFAGCKSINSFVIPNRVMRLGNGVFMDCCELSVIRIPAGLNEIESDIFQGCTELHHVFVPEGGKYKYDALLYGHDVTTYEYDHQSKDDVEQLDEYLHGIKDKFGVVYDFKEDLLLQITKSLTVYSIKPGTFGIKSNAFQIKEWGGDNKSLERLYLPDSIVIIGGGAFAYNECLEYINIPRLVTFSIEENPFAGCFNLHTIKWESQITIKDGTLIFNNEKTALIACLPWHYVEGFQKFWPLLDFARNHGKMKITSHTYSDPESGEDVTEKKCAFIHPSEKEGQGGNVVTYVSFGTKLGELSPKEIVAQKDELIVAQLDSGEYILCRREHAIIEPQNRVTLPEGLENIASKAFYGNKQLKWISLPKSLKIIGRDAFKGCHSIEEILVPSGTLNKYKSLLPDLEDIITEAKPYNEDLPF